MAGPWHPGQYEFQCLHGMGEPLYEEVVGPEKLDRPCRIYAPVGTHETLLAYLVRRLLENGANSSFVQPHRRPERDAWTNSSPIRPSRRKRSGRPGAPHPAIALPRAMFGPARKNSAGIDLANEDRLGELAGILLAGAHAPLRATPLLTTPPFELPAGLDRSLRCIANPANLADQVGTVADATMREVDAGARFRHRGRSHLGRHPGRAASRHAAPGRRPLRGRHAVPDGHDHPRGRQIARQCGRRSARGGGFPALLRDRSREAGRREAARAGGLHQPVELSRSPSSRARSRRRSRPAIRCWPSRPRKRR